MDAWFLPQILWRYYYIDHMDRRGDSLYTLRVSHLFGPDTPLMMHDAARMTIIQLMIHGMYAMGTDEFLAEEFFATLLYILLGVATYWLVFRRVVRLE